MVDRASSPHRSPEPVETHGAASAADMRDVPRSRQIRRGRCHQSKDSAADSEPDAMATGSVHGGHLNVAHGESCCDPLALGSDVHLCAEICQRLDASSGAEGHCLMARLAPALGQLSVTKHGCRVVQKALEVAGGRDRQTLLRELRGRTLDLISSPNGNHVLQKLVEVFPAGSIMFVSEELAVWGGAAVARHKFGCRVLERLLEHWPEDAVGQLVEDVIAQVPALSLHPFGNFVVQHLLEHGSSVQRASVIGALLPALPRLAQHRISSHVVQRAVDSGGPGDRLALVSTLLAGEGTLVAVACTRCGSFVAEQLLDLPQELSDGVRHVLLASLPELSESRFGRRVAARLQQARAGALQPPLESASLT